MGCLVHVTKISHNDRWPFVLSTTLQEWIEVIKVSSITTGEVAVQTVMRHFPGILSACSALFYMCMVPALSSSSPKTIFGFFGARFQWVRPSATGHWDWRLLAFSEGKGLTEDSLHLLNPRRRPQRWSTAWDTEVVQVDAAEIPQHSPVTLTHYLLLHPRSSLASPLSAGFSHCYSGHCYLVKVTVEGQGCSTFSPSSVTVFLTLPHHVLTKKDRLLWLLNKMCRPCVSTRVCACELVRAQQRGSFWHTCRLVTSMAFVLLFPAKHYVKFCGEGNQCRFFRMKRQRPNTIKRWKTFCAHLTPYRCSAWLSLSGWW